jgi:hypothetical protein
MLPAPEPMKTTPYRVVEMLTLYLPGGNQIRPPVVGNAASAAVTAAVLLMTPVESAP